MISLIPLLPLLPLFPFISAQHLPTQREHAYPIGEHSRRPPGATGEVEQYKPWSSEVDVIKRQTGSSDPCAALSRVGQQSTAFIPSDVLRCLQSVPFRNDVRNNIMASITALNSLSVFEYHQLGNENYRLAQGVNLQDEFRRINSSSYKSDYDFQTDLSNTIRRLNDGHYAWTSCYSTMFTTSHSLPIVAYGSGTDPTSSSTIRFAPDLASFITARGFSSIYSSFGISGSALASLEVTSFNGQPIWDYINNTLVSSSGVYQDPAQRLNSMFVSTQGFSGQLGRNSGNFIFANDLSSDNFTIGYKEASGQERQITVPWISIWNSRANGGSFSYTSGTSLFNALCLPRARSGRRDAIGGPALEAKSGRASTPTVHHRDLKARQRQTNTTEIPSESLPSGFSTLAQQVYRACPSLTDRASYPLPNQYDPVVSGSYLGGRDAMFFVLPNSRIGVVWLTTFDPQDASGESDEDCQIRMMVDLIAGFNNFTTRGVQNVLVDTSNNGGGVIVINQLAQRLFTGSAYNANNNFEAVLRDSPLAQALLRQTVSSGSRDAQYSPSRYRSGLSQLSSSTNFFSPGDSISVNGQSMRVSNRLQFAQLYLNNIVSTYNIPSNPIFAPENIVFTGNGLCGSSCSSFTNFLIEYYNASAFIDLNAPRQTPIEFQAFAAGQSISSTAIYADAAEIRFSNTALLPPLQVEGSFGFTIQGALSPNLSPGQFLQYRSYPAQGTFGLTEAMYLNPVEKWVYVAGKVFGSDGKRVIGASGSTSTSNLGGGASGSGGNGGSGGGSGGTGGAGRRAAGAGVGAVVGTIMLSFGMTSLI